MKLILLNLIILNFVFLSSLVENKRQKQTKQETITPDEGFYYNEQIGSIEELLTNEKTIVNLITTTNKKYFSQYVLGFLSVFAENINEKNGKGIYKEMTNYVGCSEEELINSYSQDVSDINYTIIPDNKKSHMPPSSIIYQCLQNKEEIKNEIKQLTFQLEEKRKNEKVDVPELRKHLKTILHNKKKLNNILQQDYQNLGKILKKPKTQNKTTTNETDISIFDLDKKIEEEEDNIQILKDKFFEYRQQILSYSTEEINEKIKRLQLESEVDCIKYAHNPNKVYSYTKFQKIAHLGTFTKNIISCGYKSTQIIDRMKKFKEIIMKEIIKKNNNIYVDFFNGYHNTILPEAVEVIKKNYYYYIKFVILLFKAKKDCENKTIDKCYFSIGKSEGIGVRALLSKYNF